MAFPSTAVAPSSNEARRLLTTLAMTDTNSAYQFREIVFEGRWQPGGADRPIDVRRPWSGEPVAYLSAASADDVDRAFRAPALAQSDWGATIPGQRSAVLLRAADLMEIRRRRSSVGWCARQGARRGRRGSSGGRFTTHCAKPPRSRPGSRGGSFLATTDARRAPRAAAAGRERARDRQRTDQNRSRHLESRSLSHRYWGVRRMSAGA